MRKFKVLFDLSLSDDTFYAVVALSCDVIRICARERNDLVDVLHRDFFHGLVVIAESTLRTVAPSEEMEKLYISGSGDGDDQTLQCRLLSGPWDAPERAIRCLTNLLCNDSPSISLFLMECDGLKRLQGILQAENAIASSVLFCTVRLVYMLASSW